jgi:hypothetical protein
MRHFGWFEPAFLLRNRKTREPRMNNNGNELRGALFRNDAKQPGSKRPDHRGTVVVAGIEYRISGWINQSKDGKKSLALALTRAGHLQVRRKG